MREFGIFNDEGLVEGQFYSYADAHKALTEDEDYADDEWAEVMEICPDHDEQPAFGCEECETDE